MHIELHSSIPVGTDGAALSEEQTFSQWARKRLAVYQAMERQVQVGIEQLFELASEFTLQMGDETDRILARYQQQRAEQLAQLEAVRQEMYTLRKEMEAERRAHAEELARVRRQEEADIAHRREQALAAIEAEWSKAKAERDRLLAEAYAERDRVLAETQELSARLAELQQALQRLAGLPAPALLRPLQTPASPATDKPQTADEETGGSPAVLSGERTPPPGASTGDGEPDASTAARNGSDASITTHLIIEQVESFADASRLMECLEANPSIEEVNLLLYEETTLQLAARYASGIDLEELLVDTFDGGLEVVVRQQDVLHLRSHLQLEAV